jgi:hypothetical protein
MKVKTENRKTEKWTDTELVLSVHVVSAGGSTIIIGSLLCGTKHVRKVHNVLPPY